jgi:hypothetical protein
MNQREQDRGALLHSCLHRHLLTVGIAQLNRFDRELPCRGRINDDSTNLLRHQGSPYQAE